jgi:uncharacterized membrane protein YesL
MEAWGFFRNTVTMYKTIRCHVPEDNLQIYIFSESMNIFKYTFQHARLAGSRHAQGMLNGTMNDGSKTSKIIEFFIDFISVRLIYDFPIL